MRSEITLKIPFEYDLEVAPDSTKGVMLLHGFSEHREKARKRLLGPDPLVGVTIFSPNAPFPAPVRVPVAGNRGEFEYKRAYSWYFRDPKSGDEMVPPLLSANAILTVMKYLELVQKKWILIGFSQGGFFAPFLIHAGLSVQAIIGVGAAFNPENYKGLPPISVYGLHGMQDEVVSHSYSQKSFEEIKAMGYGKNYYSLPGLGHTLDEQGRRQIREILIQEDWICR